MLIKTSYYLVQKVHNIRFRLEQSNTWLKTFVSTGQVKKKNQTKKTKRSKRSISF